MLVSSRRGAVRAPVWIDRILRPGLVFMTLHFPEHVATNVLTIDATDPKSGTAEFKATAIRSRSCRGRDATAPVADGGARCQTNGDRGPLRTGTAGRFGSRLMDLRLLLAAPTDAERAAVDTLLAAASGVATAALPRRPRMGTPCTAATRPATSAHLLLPVLRAVQARIGWISEGALDYVCERLDGPAGRRVGVATFYALLSMDPAAAAGPARVRRHRVPLPGRRAS